MVYVQTRLGTVAWQQHPGYHMKNSQDTYAAVRERAFMSPHQGNFTAPQSCIQPTKGPYMSLDLLLTAVLSLGTFWPPNKNRKQGILL